MAESAAVRAYIGLGSNLEEPRFQIERALRALASLPHSDLVRYSPFYQSEPMGPPDQPQYINAVAALDTELSPLELLSELQAIETAQGRERGPQRWGPRTLDLDLLLYGQQEVQLPELTVPHPGVVERNFVLMPLFDIAPDLVLPDGRPLRAIAAGCSLGGLVRLDN